MGTLEYLKYRASLLKRLLNTTDLTILKRIEKAFDNEDNNPEKTPDELQQLLAQSEEDIKNNRFISHKKVMDSFSK